MSRLIAALIVITVAGLMLTGPGFGGVAFAAPDPGKKAPARQVPVEEIEEPDAENAPVHTGSITEMAGEEAPDDGSREKPHTAKDPETTSSGGNDKKDKEAAGGEGSPAPPAPPRNPVKVTDKSDRSDTSDKPDKPEQSRAPGDGYRGPATARKKPAESAESMREETGAFPGLPVRKPAKPPVPITGRLNPDVKRTSRDRMLPPPGRARDKYLCKALQACRNAFIRCKSKIKYPDQSKEWSVAKEACGAKYKKCVEKDFRPGEWFFTRWFYFQELKCE